MNRNDPKTMGAFFNPPEPEPDHTWPDDGRGRYQGVHPEVPEGEYRSHSAISHSDIRHWLKARKLGRVGVVGSATHSLFLEGRAALDAGFISTDEDFDLRTASGKERAAELIGDSGKELLRHKERMLVERMFKALTEDDVVQEVLGKPGDNEVSLVGKFEGFGQDYKARLDMVREKALWDLKTTSHINEADWKKSEVDFGYINQAAWYSGLYAALTGNRLPFVFICVGKREPHNVWTRVVPKELMAHGDKWREDVLTLYERYVPQEMRAKRTKEMRDGTR